MTQMGLTSVSFGIQPKLSFTSKNVAQETCLPFAKTANQPVGDRLNIRFGRQQPDDEAGAIAASGDVVIKDTERMRREVYGLLGAADFWPVQYTPRGPGHPEERWQITLPDGAGMFKSFEYTYQGPSSQTGLIPAFLQKTPTYHLYDQTRESIKIVMPNGHEISWSGTSEGGQGPKGLLKRQLKGHHFRELRERLSHMVGEQSDLRQKYGIQLPVEIQPRDNVYRIPNEDIQTIRDNVNHLLSLVPPNACRIIKDPNRQKWTLVPEAEDAIFQKFTHYLDGPIESIEIVLKDGETLSWSKTTFGTGFRFSKESDYFKYLREQLE